DGAYLVQYEVVQLLHCAAKVRHELTFELREFGHVRAHLPDLTTEHNRRSVVGKEWRCIDARAHFLELINECGHLASAIGSGFASSSLPAIRPLRTGRVNRIHNSSERGRGW